MGTRVSPVRAEVYDRSVNSVFTDNGPKGLTEKRYDYFPLEVHFGRSYYREMSTERLSTRHLIVILCVPRELVPSSNIRDI